MEKIIEDNKIVKLSTCPKCNGWVRLASKNYLEEDKSAGKEFFKEVAKHGLNISEMPLEKYKEAELERCSCK